MRVLWIAPAFYPAINYGGPTFSGLGLCRGLAAAGVDLRVLTTNDGGYGERLEVDTKAENVLEGFRIRYCPGLIPRAFSSEILARLPGAIHWADVVHLTSVYNFTTVPSLLACRVQGKATVWSPRGALQRWEGSSRLGLKAIFEATCRGVAPARLVLHATSDEEARESLERFPRAQARVVPNGVDLPERVLEKAPSKALRILFLGRLDIKKGLDVLLKAAAIAHQTFDLDFTLNIAGTGTDGYVQSLKTLAETLGIQERVRFAGYVNDSQKGQVFADADVLVVPSHTENFARVIPEALAHAVPVIASRGTPWSGLAERGAGWWVENTPQALAEVLSAARAAPLKSMGEIGRAWAIKEFAWGAVTEKMLKLYEQVV